MKKRPEKLNKIILLALSTCYVINVVVLVALKMGTRLLDSLGVMDLFIYPLFTILAGCVIWFLMWAVLSSKWRKDNKDS